MSHTGGKHTKVLGAQKARIPHRAVDHHASDLFGGGIGGHDLAHQGVGQISPRIDHNHVTGLGHLNGFVDHQIVPRAGLHRQGGSHHGVAVVHRAQGGTGGKQSGQGVTHDGNRHRFELCDRLG